MSAPFVPVEDYALLVRRGNPRRLPVASTARLRQPEEGPRDALRRVGRGGTTCFWREHWDHKRWCR